MGNVWGAGEKCNPALMPLWYLGGHTGSKRQCRDTMIDAKYVKYEIALFDDFQLSGLDNRPVSLLHRVLKAQICINQNLAILLLQ